MVSMLGLRGGPTGTRRQNNEWLRRRACVEEVSRGSRPSPEPYRCRSQGQPVGQARVPLLLAPEAEPEAGQTTGSVCTLRSC